MSLYIPQMSDTPAITIPGLASNFNALADSRIVEYGSNENGRYWRWENGLQMCRHYTRLYGESGKTLFEARWNYPANFLTGAYRRAAESIFVIASSHGGLFESGMAWEANLPASRVVNVASVEYDYAVFTLESGIAYVESRFSYLMMLAVGRWK